MKYLGILLFASQLTFAGGINTADLVGQYTLVGNGGFLVYDLTFTTTQSSKLVQTMLYGPKMECHGLYRVDDTTELLTTIYNCPADDTLMLEAPLMGVNSADLDTGVQLQVHIKSSLGTDSTVLMLLKRH